MDAGIETALLRALHDDPAEPTAWLALADWLEEHDQPDRAELLRLSRALRHDLGPHERGELEGRLQGLLAGGVRPCVPVLTNAVGMAFALVPPGAFVMGSPE